MTGAGQRAFAQKLIKQGAAEVRRQVSSTVFQGEVPKSVSGVNLAAGVGAQVPITDVVDPPDFEDFVLQNQTVIDRDPYRHLLQFPDNDIEIQTVQKASRTILPLVPEPGAEPEPHVHDCVKTYTSDFSVVTRRFHVYGAGSQQIKDIPPSVPQEYEIDCEPQEDDQEESPKRTSIHINDTPRGSWASSIFDLKNSQADPMLPTLLKRVDADEVDRNNERQRQEDRQDALFSLCPVQDEDECVERRSIPDIPTEHFGHRILIKCLQLKLELEVEPIFASMALYDLRERKKISETFYFDLNIEPLKRMISLHVPHQDISTMSRTALFSITYPSPEVFLVIKLEKVLQQGDITEAAEPYMKEDKTKEEKYRTNAQQFCDRLGQYHMPFAWTAIYLTYIVNGANSLEREGSVDVKTDIDTSRTASLDRRTPGMPPGQFESFRKRVSRDDLSAARRGSLERGRTGYEKHVSWSPDDYGSGLDNLKPITLTISSFFKQEADKLSDDDLYKFLADLKRPSSVLKRLKCIPCSLKLDISQCPDEPKHCLTSELYKVDPYPEDKSRPIKEILEFPSREVYTPYTVYRNLMFVYTRNVNFANRQGSARNIVVKVQVMHGEDDHSAIPVIFGKSSCPELSREAYTTVTYHNKAPDFSDEFKIKLPARLMNNHHLLFTFYHISCQNKKNEQTPVEVPVGYTWLPLLKNNRLLVGEFLLPVSVEKLPPRYSMYYPDLQLPGMKWVDNHKGVFSVDIIAESSIHTQDEYLDKFLSLCQISQESKNPMRMSESTYETLLIQSVKDVEHANPEPLVKFLPLIFNKMIGLLVQPPFMAGQLVNIGQTVFESIVMIVRRLQALLIDQNDLHGRNMLLATYIQYLSNLPHTGSLHTVCTSPNLMSTTGSYATLGRPTSLPVSKQSYQRSSSDPDLPGSNPNSPDFEVATLLGTRTGDRKNSVNRGDTLPANFPANFSKLRGKKLVHEELVLQWLVSSGTTRDISLTNAWFLFEVMVKSMTEHLSRTDKLNAPWTMRFPDSFVDDVTALIEMLTRDIVDKYVKEPVLVSNLNTSLAFFLQDILSLMDRGFVFQLIRYYCKNLAVKMAQCADITTPMVLRLDFLRIICSHEHFFPLNLPFGTPLTPSAPSSPSPSVSSSMSQMSYTSTSTLTDKGVYTELSMDFRQQHFLVGLVLGNLMMSLETQIPLLHSKSINLIRHLLHHHDLDVRYADPDVKSRLASLYLPLIGIIMETLPQIYDPNTEGKIRTSACFEEEGDRIDQKVAMAIAGGPVYGRPLESPSINRGGANTDTGAADSKDKSRKCMLSAECSKSLLSCLLWVLKNADSSVLRHWWSTMHMAQLNQVLEALYLAISNFEYKAKWAVPLQQQEWFQQWQQRRKDLCSLLSSSTETLEDWQESGNGDGRYKNGGGGSGSIGGSNGNIASGGWSGRSPALHEQIWEGIARKSQDLFRGTGALLNRQFREDPYSSSLQGKKAMAQCSQQTLRKSVDMKSRLEEAILGTGSARSEMMRRKHSSLSLTSGDKTPPTPTGEGNSKLRWRKDQFWRQPLELSETSRPRETELDVHVEGSLAAEVGMICLDTLELIIQIAQHSDSMQLLLNSALRVLLHAFGLNQSTLALQNIFATQRSLVSKFPEMLFEDETEECADLCLRLLRHCSACISATRSQASASLYLLMRQNFEMGNNFARVKMQVTMSLSSLVGQNQNFNEEYLRKSLKTILTYAEADIELQETSFPGQVRDLVFNLHMILSDTVKMKEFQEDPEMLLDLMYRIAKGYQNSPDLRLTWLQNMAGKHSEKGNHAEASHCLIHAAGLVAEYLNMLEDREHLPVGCVAFQRVSANVLEESAVSDDVVTPDGEGICTGKYFTESGLVGLLEQAASSFTMGSMYEAVNEVYKVLIPIHEANREFKKLAHIHGKLQESFNNVIRQKGKRMFGTYFRVGFYGKMFGDLDGEEFVYKEPAITKLPEISHRLESFYSDRFGEEAVETVKDSNTVERDKLNPEKAYIQITYVEPYFDAYEMRERVTYFDKNYNIKRFMYATPFTLNGRAHGELSEQYKRKTILTTNHTFPYVKTRLNVINREQIILSPIEVAIEDIQKKTRELAIALSQEPADTKMLQMVLQGCIGTTVNQGPLEVAMVFLLDICEGRQVAMKYHNKLRLCFKDFLKKCEDSLHRNKSLIVAEQKDYQRELERNFRNIKDKLGPMISSKSSTTLRRPKQKKDGRSNKPVALANASEC